MCCGSEKFNRCWFEAELKSYLYKLSLNISPTVYKRILIINGIKFQIYGVVAWTYLINIIKFWSSVNAVPKASNVIEKNAMKERKIPAQTWHGVKLSIE